MSCIDVFLLNTFNQSINQQCNTVLADRGDLKMVLKKLLNVSPVASCSS